MTELNVINTWSLGPITHRMNLRDLDLVSTSSGTVLYATNGSTGGVVNFSVNASTGALSYRDAITLPHLASVDRSVHLEQTRFGGQDYIVNLGRHADGLEAIRIGNGSNLDTRVDIFVRVGREQFAVCGTGEGECFAVVLGCDVGVAGDCL